MQVVWHGTNKENAAAILKEGFKPRSYFAAHLEDAVSMGGPYIFEVWFEEEFRAESWQIVIREAVPPERILRHYKVDRTSIFENKDAQRAMRLHQIKGEFGPDAALCEACDGTGSIGPEHPPFTHWKEKLKTGKMCEECYGTGCPEAGAAFREGLAEEEKRTDILGD